MRSRLLELDQSKLHMTELRTTMDIGGMYMQELSRDRV